jgi:hypothetical protein
MLSHTSALLPGIYPEIINLKPKIGGNNNLGVGVDSNGKEYVLKTGNSVCVAEFIGAAVCAALAIPHCTPTIVCRTDLFGRRQHLFGSAIEPEVHRFDMASPLEWAGVTAEMCDTTMFSLVLAVDLCIGNDDRHAGNWIVRTKGPANGMPHHQLMAMDFSNSWPTAHPPHRPRAHPSRNTWHILRYWPAMGIAFDELGFRAACAKITLLDGAWLKAVLDPMVTIWLTTDQRDLLCDWWQHHLKDQVIDVIYSLEPDGEWL